MSASIYWQPVGDGKYVGGGSTFWKSLCEAVDENDMSEIRLDESHLARLHAFRAGIGDRDDRKQVTILIEAIQSCGQIRVWVAY